MEKMYNSVLLFHLICFISVCCQTIHLERLSTLYIPVSYDASGVPLFSLDGGSAEKSAYDPSDRMVYIVGAAKINVIDISNVRDPKMVYHQLVGNFDPTDVELCGNYAFVGLDNNEDREAGRVVVFKKYDRLTNTMDVVLNVTVGPLPDKVLPSSDCKTLLVALEGEAFARDGRLIDPEGGVGLFKFSSGDISPTTYNYTKLAFTRYNSRWTELTKSGVRFIRKENNNTFAQDLEPEYIAYNKDETKAYICLQENNAVAVVDIITENITGIYGLGFKQWNTSKFDASDKDDEISIRKWPVFGMYQPDSIYTVHMNGIEYLITANEGDSKDYSGYVTNGFNEEVRVKDLNLSNDSYVKTWALNRNITDITQDPLLGRLTVTTENGRSVDGSTYDALYTFGGRGFSVFRTDTMSLVYDSGNSVEETHAQLTKDLFNANVKENDNIADTFDTRSDNKGPESESVAIAHLENKLVVFLGNERPGSISIYSFSDSMTSPKFESIYRRIDSPVDKTWKYGFNERLVSELDPDIRYIPEKDSPNGQHMLIASGSVSGTLSIFKINGLDINNSNAASDVHKGSYWCLLWTMLTAVVFKKFVVTLLNI